MSTSSTHYKDAGKLLNPKSTIAKITSQKLLDNKDARFINLEKLEYISPIGKTGVWEMARRTTRPKDSQVDAVIIVPILNFTNGNKKLVFVRQFRPPTNGIVVEFPAGLVDPNDSIESCAIRELKEETGFSGVIRKKSGIVWSDPGLSDASCCVVWIDVDMSLEENQHPVPQWMDSEVIEVVEVDLDNVENTVDNWISQGYLIDAKVQTLLVGMSLSL
jgi:8-oxo-dGTP pyrophosphatase MutT (NUDIX family)